MNLYKCMLKNVRAEVGGWCVRPSVLVFMSPVGHRRWRLRGRIPRTLQSASENDRVEWTNGPRGSVRLPSLRAETFNRDVVASTRRARAAPLHLHLFPTRLIPLGSARRGWNSHRRPVVVVIDFGAEKPFSQPGRALVSYP